MATVSAQRAREAGEAVAAAVSQSEAYRRSARVLLYAARFPELPLEGLLSRMMRDHKAPLWPRIRGEELEFAPCGDLGALVPGAFGLLEPPESSRPTELTADDLLLLPGLAFDARGARLGRGRSFFDRALASGEASKAFRCGVGYAFQWVPEVPEEPWDLRVEAFASPLGFFALGDGP